VTGDRSDLGHRDAASKPEGKEAVMGTKFKDIPPLTDEEEAQIQRQIAADPDAPEATDEQIALARPFAEVFPDLAESIRRSRGRPKAEKPLQHISLRLDPDVVAKFKATGKGWQGRINDVLKAAKV
jgi:uncharacterized protein (DUF4415 family)